jgi:hypothetical protein
VPYLSFRVNFKDLFDTLTNILLKNEGNDVEEDERKDDSTEIKSSPIRDYFETDYFNRDKLFNQSFVAEYELSLNFKIEESGVEYKIPILRKLIFDYQANSIYSSFFLGEAYPPKLMVTICKQLIYLYAQNPLYNIPPPLLYDIKLRKGEHDRFQSNKRLIDTRYMIIYCRMDLSNEQKEEIYRYGDTFGMYIKVRDQAYANSRAEQEKPLAFISHDSRDKDDIARPLAQELTRILGRVWFDEYSLRIGDSLRESIERGLKECKRCVLILTPNFLSNTGWTKTEFNSIFTRELIERKNVVMPVWAGVSEKEVYGYSPS